jgi:hypothetical protein
MFLGCFAVLHNIEEDVRDNLKFLLTCYFRASEINEHMSGESFSFTLLLLTSVHVCQRSTDKKLDIFMPFLTLQHELEQCLPREYL